jgi:hypothetical protein
MRQGSGGEPADRSIEKLIILVKLNNVFGGSRVVQQTVPRFPTIGFMRSSAAGRLKAGRGTF